MLEAFDSGHPNGADVPLFRGYFPRLPVFIFSPSLYYIHTGRRRVAVSYTPRLTPPPTSFSFQLLSVTRTWLAPHDNGLRFLKCFNTGYYRFATGSPTTTTTTSTEFLLPSSFHRLLLSIDFFLPSLLPDKASIQVDKNLSPSLSFGAELHARLDCPFIPNSPS